MKNTNTNSNPIIYGKDWADYLGVWLSSVCVLHCILTPIVLMLLPAISVSTFGESVHQVLAAILPVIAIFAFVPGFRRHRAKAVLILGALGLLSILFCAFQPFGPIGEGFETGLTLLGSSFLSVAHLRNRKLRCQCDHQT